MGWRSAASCARSPDRAVRGNTLICEFGAIAEDELAHASPGDFLFFDNIREACESGLDGL